MKTAEEFRSDVYEKKGAAVAAKRKMNRRATLCVSMALIVTLCGVGLPRLLAQKDGVDLRPRLLQVGSPKNPVDLSDDKALEEELKEAIKAENQEKIEQLQELIDQDARERADISEDLLLDERFAENLNRFSAEAARQLQMDATENACFSPVTLYYNFSLLTAGADGDTADSLYDLIHADPESLSEQCRRYYAQHYHNKADNVFQLENSLWLDSTHTYYDEFIQKAEECFYSSLFRVDFEDPTVAEDMSKWVSYNTDGRITPKFNLSKEHKASILNCLDYQAAWDCDFDPAETTAGTFTKSDGSTVTTDYMHTTTQETVYTLKGEDGATFTAASIPLTNYDTMVFVLPDEEHIESLGDVFQSDSLFQSAFLYKFAADSVTSTVAEIDWSIPKFEIKAENDFADMLPSIARNEVLADFSNMGNVELSVYKVQHDISFSIDENGIEAAASTVTDLWSTSEAPAETVEINLNRPFAFAVISRSATYGGKYDSVVYCGVCGDPTQN